MTKVLRAAVTAAVLLGPVIPACASAPASRATTQRSPEPAASAAITAEQQRRGVKLSNVPVFHFSRCPESVREQFAGDGLRCEKVKAPLDYTRPGGRKVTLQLAVKLHTSSRADYRGVMLANPGGPGTPGLYLATAGSYLPAGVSADYDWIGYDSRGVGDSKPSLSCEPTYFEGPRRAYGVHTAGAKNYWTQRIRGYADACGRSMPALLRHMTSLDDARDLDTIRRALRLRRISFYGMSAGTYVGQLFATRFPSRLQRLVLDSNVDPRRVWFRHDIDQDAGWQRNVHTFFAWCAAHNSSYRLGSTAKAVQALYWRELGRLQAHPQAALGGDEFADGMSLVGYSDHLWSAVAAAWQQLVAGHPAAFTAEYGQADAPGGDNQYAVSLATECSDARWPSLSRQLAAYRRQARKNPFYAWPNGWYDAPCAFWPVAGPRHPATVSGHRVAALLIDETDDAATPYSGSLEVRRLFPRSRLVAVSGGVNHADSLSGNRCVASRIAAYLLADQLPRRQPGTRADVRCAPAPHPST